MAILLALFAPNAASIAEHAAIIAGDQPYCLQVSSSAGYRQARTISDFSALSMWAPSSGGMYLEFHAVLAVGEGVFPQVYNWSYRKRDFDKIKSMPIALVCSPTRRFVGSLPAFVASPDSNPQRIRVAGFDFTIPASYHPRIFNQVSNPILTLRTSAPAFSTISEPLPAGDLGLSVYLKPGQVSGWLNRQGNTIVEDRGESIFGLRQRALVSFLKSGQRSERLELYDRSEDGEVTTAIWCSAEGALRVAKCPVIYLQGDLLYHFHIPGNELGTWRETEIRAARLIASFLTSGSKLR